MNRCDLESEYELRRILGPQHETAPQLLARQGVEQRHQRVVDLYQVFEPHGRILPQSMRPLCAALLWRVVLLTPFPLCWRFTVLTHNSGE